MSLFVELKRRNVFRVAIAYIVVAWVLAQVAGFSVETFGAPDWVLKIFTVFLMLGFPVALIFAWAFEMTADGIKLEKNVDRTQSITQQTGRKLDFIVIALLVLGVVYLGYDKFLRSDQVNTLARQEAGNNENAGVVIEKSVAVLPFANRSAREEDAFFVDGMHDDILTQLARIAELKVISRTSVERFKGTTQSIGEIGEILGVRHILEGGVQRAGDRVRINMQLIDAETDEHLWADSFDRELTASNIFSIQSEIAIAIANALAATLTSDEKNRLGSVPTNNLQALEEYFKGRQKMATRSTGPLQEAQQHFTSAVELDPEFALAWVGLADTHMLRWCYGGIPREDALRQSEKAVEKALDIDPGLGEAHTSHASNADFLQKSDETVRRRFERAIKLNPNYATAYHWYGNYLNRKGLYVEALPLSLKAADLDPLSTIILSNLAGSYNGLGQIEQARLQWGRVIELDPELPAAYAGEAFILYAQGKLAQALPLFQKAHSLDPGNRFIFGAQASIYLDLSDIEAAEMLVQRFLEKSPNSRSSLASALALSYRKGDIESALDYANRIAENPVRGTDGRYVLAVMDLQANDPETARQRFEPHYPELFSDIKFEVDAHNYFAAIIVARILIASGDQDRADRLLEKSLEFMKSQQRNVGLGYTWSDILALTTQGKKQEALAALRAAVDSGWRRQWWWVFDLDPGFESIRNEPGFLELRQVVADDMQRQLTEVRGQQGTGP